MKNIKLSNGDEYTVCSSADELHKFATAHTHKLSDVESFEAWPHESNDVYQVGPFKFWLHKSTSVNKENQTLPSDLFCVDYQGKTYYFPSSVFVDSYRNKFVDDPKFVWKNMSTFVFYDLGKSSGIRPYDSVLWTELDDLGFTSISKYRIDSPWKTEAYMAIEKLFSTINSGAKEKLTARQDFKVFCPNYYNLGLMRAFNPNPDIPKFTEFMTELVYHIGILRSLWIMQNKKVKSQAEKDLSESNGMSVKEYRQSLKDKEFEIKSIKRVAAVVNAAPALIKFRDNLNLFVDKLGKGDKFDHNDVNQLRRYLKDADQEILKLRFLGKF